MPGMGIRIYRWAEAPNEYRRALVGATRDRTPRTHLAVVPGHRTWDPPARWTDVARVVLDSGDELVAGTEPAPRPRPEHKKLRDAFSVGSRNPNGPSGRSGRPA